MRIKKIIYISLQHDNEVNDAIKFNEEHNFEYLIYDDTNLIDRDNLFLMVNKGYNFYKHDTGILFVHKTYDYDKEKVVKKEGK